MNVVGLEEIKKLFSSDPFTISDTHFFHDRVFKEFEPVRQKFAPSREEFDKKMAKVMRQYSPLLHLGDVVINSKDERTFESRIRAANNMLEGCQKLLIMGNHDRGGETFYKAGGWIVVKHGVDLVHGIEYPETPPFVFHEVCGQRLFLSHEPVLINREEYHRDNQIVKDLTSWFLKLGATKNVHGHVHSNTLKNHIFCNVSVEAMDFRPQRLSHVISAERNDLTLKREER